jgi:hypothetical protein
MTVSASVPVSGAETGTESDAVSVAVPETVTVAVPRHYGFDHRDGLLATDVPSFDIVRSSCVIVAGETPARQDDLNRGNAKDGNRRAQPPSIGLPARKQATLTSRNPAQAGDPGRLTVTDPVAVSNAG